MINARPHINGNTPEDFGRVGHALRSVYEQLEAALVDVKMTITHGRNYQHLADRAAAARQEDIRRIRGVEALLPVFEHLVLDMENVMQEVEDARTG